MELINISRWPISFMKPSNNCGHKNKAAAKGKRLPELDFETVFIVIAIIEYTNAKP